MTATAHPGEHLLVLGPVLRYVDESAATVWVRTSRSALVEVERAGRRWSAPTFAAHGSHYALVVLDGLEPGTDDPYSVLVDDEPVWPRPGVPESRIRTLEPGREPYFAFGSCRTTGSHDEDGNAAHGVDALRSLGIALRDDPQARWPDVLMFLGDQVYADTAPNPELEEFMASRRSLDEPPGTEIKDFVEYAELYHLAWSDEVVRWVLSTLPSAMIFDDHDIRDDWNTSWSWREEIRRTSWWQERIVGGLASYWVYQHIGNLSPADLAEDALWGRIVEHGESGAADELDLTEALDALATRADEKPETYRWSHTRSFGNCTFVVLDSRAARDLSPDGRKMLDETEMRWFDELMRGGVEHIFVGTSLPFLLPPGLHDFEALDESLAAGAFGRRVAKPAEAVRRTIDLEHWAAFNESFEEVFEIVMDVARGARGAAPATITFLSGDVHNSYLAEVTHPERHGATSRIVQAVCSPIRNPMPRGVRVVMSMFARSLGRPMRALTRRSRRIPDPPYPWTITHGPWFANNLALCRVEGPALELSWVTGVVGDDPTQPELQEVCAARLEGAERSTPRAGGVEG